MFSSGFATLQKVGLCCSRLPVNLAMSQCLLLSSFHFAVFSPNETGNPEATLMELFG